MSEIMQVEFDIEQAKAKVELRDRIERLLANPDFRAVIVQHFMTDECARYVGVSVDDNVSEAERKDALAFAQASGYLKRWIQVSCTMGNVAENTVSGLTETLAELRQEEAAARPTQVEV